MEARHMVYTLVVAQRFEVSPMTSHDFWSRLCFTARARCHYVPKKLAVQFSRLRNRFSKAPKFGSPSFVLHSTKLPFAYGHRYNLLSLYYVEEEMQDLQTVGF